MHGIDVSMPDALGIRERRKAGEELFGQRLKGRAWHRRLKDRNTLSQCPRPERIKDELPHRFHHGLKIQYPFGICTALSVELIGQELPSTEAPAEPRNDATPVSGSMPLPSRRSRSAFAILSASAIHASAGAQTTEKARARASS